MRAAAARKAEKKQRRNAGGLDDDGGERCAARRGPRAGIDAVQKLIEINGALRVAHAGQQQAQIAIVMQAHVGERRGGGPPDDFAFAFAIRDDHRAVAAGLRDADRRVVAVPANRRGHFKLAGTRQRIGAFRRW